MPDLDLHQMFLDEHERAKESRAADGFKDESFMPHATVVDPEGKLVMIACPFGNNSEKTMAMNYIWMTAKKENAIAVLFSSDSRQIHSDRYCKHYGITMDVFEEHRQRTLREVGGGFGNLPHEVWEDTVITWAMGPNFPDGFLSTPYKEGPDDTVVFAPPTPTKDGITRQSMLTKWW